MGAPSRAEQWSDVGSHPERLPQSLRLDRHLTGASGPRRLPLASVVASTGRLHLPMSRQPTRRRGLRYARYRYGLVRRESPDQRAEDASGDDTAECERSENQDDYRVRSPRELDAAGRERDASYHWREQVGDGSRLGAGRCSRCHRERASTDAEHPPDDECRFPGLDQDVASRGEQEADREPTGTTAAQANASRRQPRSAGRYIPGSAGVSTNGCRLSKTPGDVPTAKTPLSP